VCLGVRVSVSVRVSVRVRVRDDPGALFWLGFETQSPFLQLVAKRCKPSAQRRNL